ncbi:hypothetical protein OMP38_02775 [Cohnella ginsengisoli]|uniref:Cardiolipin synthase N-terminal domain-containing protein n=1 Tax=Cohnella ginsengisoli TaxID=425004 RepID=A0A9X4KGY4_9BACL|nr:hypothetical protein [Cohnella ginsengisoli]MDG0789887.1 hypothetical protein [Cohnella ginsengisoli]
MIDNQTAIWFLIGLFGFIIAAAALLIGHVKVVSWVSDDCEKRGKSETNQYLSIAGVFCFPLIGIGFYLLLRWIVHHSQRHLKS